MQLAYNYMYLPSIVKKMFFPEFFGTNKNRKKNLMVEQLLF